MSDELKNRYDFVYLFDVKDGNPNGDPDAENLPRVDAETGLGLVTDVCLKRKIRNFVELAKGLEEDREHFDIYIRERAILNQQNELAYKAIGAEEELKSDKKRKGGGRVEEAKNWMCSKFYDIRTFGAVMSTGINCGQVRGPVQFTFGRSIDPIVISEHSITRMAVATEKEAEAQSGDNRTMGRKSTVPYGLYIAHGFISAPLAKQTGFNEEDLELFWNALINMFECDRSAARGLMSARKLYVFKHLDPIGSAPAYKLFDLIKIERENKEQPARSFSDYKITVAEKEIPDRVELIEKI